MTAAQPPLPALLGLATAVPPYRLNQADIAAKSAELFAGAYADFQRLMGIYGNAAVETRYSCVPLDWYAEPHDFKTRNAVYVASAVDLLEDAATRALAGAGLAADSVDAVVCVSTTGIATPSLDALVMERMRLRRDARRLPVFGLGCAGGVVGLARAAEMAAARPGATVLLLVVELCGPTFRKDDPSKSNVVATALFGDGAAAAVLRAGNGAGPGAVTLRAWGEHTWPGTLDVMGWHVENDGFGVLFSPEIPAIVRRHYRPALDEFLAGHGLGLADIDGFAMHPGGARVVAALEEVMDLAAGNLAESRAVLRDYGNMSAPTALFVLERLLAKPNPAGRLLISSLGPGFTAGFMIAEQS